MTVVEVERITSVETTNRSYGGSRTAFLLDDLVIKMPSGVHSLAAQEIEDIGALFEKAKARESVLDKKGHEYRGLTLFGLEQTLAEWDVWDNCPNEYRHLLCPIVGRGFTTDNVPYTIMRRANTIEDWQEYEDDEDSWQDSIENFFEIYGNCFSYAANDCAAVIEEIIALCEIMELGFLDFDSNWANIGEIDGKIALIDYGFGHNWIGEN